LGATLSLYIHDGCLEEDLAFRLVKEFRIKEHRMIYALRCHDTGYDGFLRARAQWQEGVGRERFKPYILVKNDPCASFLFIRVP